jgi:hypothetical protein
MTHQLCLCVHTTGAQAARQAAAERDRRAAQAAASSARILQEEQAKDADWRARMMAQVQQVGGSTWVWSGYLVSLCGQRGAAVEGV